MFHAMDIALYPQELENWWLGELDRQLGRKHTPADLRKLEEPVAALSDRFTTERSPGFAGYADDDRMLLAYGLFFFPQNFVRVQLVLNEALRVSRWTAPSGRPLRILDLGAGTGAAGLSVASRLAQDAGRDMELHALDHSAVSLGILDRVFQVVSPTLCPLTELFTYQGHLLHPPKSLAGPWDVIVVSYALNEVALSRPEDEIRSWLRTTIGELAADGLLLICEPVVKASTERIEKLRDWIMANRVAQVLAPCLHGKPCPMLALRKGWCHDVRRWQIPESVSFINRRLFREIDVLKFSFLALSRHAQAPPPDTADHCRLVAPVMAHKGKLVFTGCAGDGELHVYEILTRTLSRAEEDDLLSLERGERIRWPGCQPLGDGATLRANGRPERMTDE